jgi:hypothetical protein
MPPQPINELIPIIQTAVGPVILISGVGLLLLTMTNRLGRVIDRARSLDSKLPQVPEETRPTVEDQLTILWRRARVIRLAIGLACSSALFAALLVILLFFSSLLHVAAAWLISGLFVACMLLLIASLLVFLQDINLSLAALKIELYGDRETRRSMA